MTITVNIQNIASATSDTLYASSGLFDIVKIGTNGLETVTLFLPEGAGAAVADAINAAVRKGGE